MNRNAQPVREGPALLQAAETSTIARMLFSDLALSRRLESAEGHACVQFAEARRRLFPDSGAEWMECAGAYAVFDGIDSPVTQTFGLGIFEEPGAAALAALLI
jgi:hypothetical protein